MNTDKVIGNFLVAFTTALLASLAVVGIGGEALAIAIANALLLGAAAAGKELCEEDKDNKIPKKIKPTLCKITTAAVLL